jgi:hypothetical protein
MVQKYLSQKVLKEYLESKCPSSLPEFYRKDFLSLCRFISITMQCVDLPENIIVLCKRVSAFNKSYLYIDKVYYYEAGVEKVISPACKSISGPSISNYHSVMNTSVPLFVDLYSNSSTVSLIHHCAVRNLYSI